MIVYVDANLFLDIALEREQKNSVQGILHLAETQALQLAFPVLAALEPYSFLTYSKRDRNKLTAQLTALSRELTRSYHRHFRALEQISDILQYVESLHQKEIEALDAVISRALWCGRSLPFTDEVRAVARTEARYTELDAKDAIIYAAIKLDLQRLRKSGSDEQAFFLSADFRAFGKLASELAALGCRYFRDFSAALQAINALRGNSGQP